jgi:hypothetical protein
MGTSEILHHERRTRVLAGLALVVSALLAAALDLPRAHGGRADYVGAQACKDCHADAFAAWEQSAHATTRAMDGAGRGRSACLACHTTGEAPAGPSWFAGVQCEACHGPGAGYASDDVMRNPTLARLLGLRDLSTPAARAALCAECHARATRLAPFDAEAAYRRIQHR